MPLDILDHKGILGELAPGLAGRDAVPAILSLADNFLQRPEAHRLYAESALHKPPEEVTPEEMLEATSKVSKLLEMKITLALADFPPNLFGETGTSAGRVRIELNRDLVYAVRSAGDNFNQLALLVTILHECSHLVFLSEQSKVTPPSIHYTSRFSIVKGVVQGESGFALEGHVFGGILTALFDSLADRKDQRRWEKVSGLALEVISVSLPFRLYTSDAKTSQVGPMVSLEEYEASKRLNGRPFKALPTRDLRLLSESRQYILFLLAL